MVRKEKTEALLVTRMQLPNENVALVTEEMTKLFYHADPEMPEDKKVRLLMRGLKQEHIAGLMRNPPNSVQEFVSEATTTEKTLEMHTRQYNCHSTPGCAETQMAFLK